MNALIVEDDRRLNQGIVLGIKEAGDEFTQCYNLETAEQQFKENTYDLVILDINLPDGSGFDFLKKIRTKSKVPVLILTANDLEMDEVMGFELGANDFVTKPFSLMVLKARIKNLLRNQTEEKEIYQMDDMLFDFDTMNFRKGSQALVLSKTEQKLLRIFLKNKGKVLSKETLIDHIWSGEEEYVDENAIYVSIKRLREKLTSEGEHQYIQTVYGMGYMWKNK